MDSKDFVVDDQNLLTDKTWWQLRPHLILMPHTSWVEIKSFIIKICKKYKCGGSVSNWERTVYKIDKNIMSVD